MLRKIVVYNTAWWRCLDVAEFVRCCLVMYVIDLPQFGSWSCFNVWLQEICIPPPHRVTGNSQGEGVLKEQKFLKRTMRVNWTLKRDGVWNQKKRSVGGVWIFSGETELTSLIDSSKFYQRNQGHNFSSFLKDGGYVPQASEYISFRCDVFTS